MSPIPLSRSALLLLSVLPACGAPPSGKPLDEVIPDLSVLVTTQDAAGVRRLLAQAQAPASEAHNQRLLGMLRDQVTISAAHLSLLVHAVALPSQVMVSDGSGVWRYADRGRAPNSAFVDQLLTEGAPRLKEVDGHWLGDLIGITQSDATLQLYAARWLAIDDGSERALDEVLDGMRGSPACLPFLCEVLAPRGRLDGDAGWHVLAGMSFDSERLPLMRTLLERGTTITDDRLVAAMKLLSFDSSREQMFALLLGKLATVAIDKAAMAIATFSFDSSRQAAFATLSKHEKVQLDEHMLLRLVKLCAFDSGRLDCIEKLAPRLRGPVDGAAAKALLAAFSFDGGRMEALKVLRPRLLELDVSERQLLVTRFSFDSNQKQALAALMK